MIGEYDPEYFLYSVYEDRGSPRVTIGHSMLERVGLASGDKIEVRDVGNSLIISKHREGDGEDG